MQQTSVGILVVSFLFVLWWFVCYFYVLFSFVFNHCSLCELVGYFKWYYFNYWKLLTVSSVDLRCICLNRSFVSQSIVRSVKQKLKRYYSHNILRYEVIIINAFISPSKQNGFCCTWKNLMNLVHNSYNALKNSFFRVRPLH